MMNVLRKIAALFGAHYVVLTDFDGEETVIRRRAGSNGVYRFPHVRESFCVLENGGTVRMPYEDGGYVISWKPYRP